MNEPTVCPSNGNRIKTPATDWRSGFAPWFAGALLALASGPPAAAQVFTLDTNQSSISISGSILGYSLAQQGPGSLTAAYSGAIQTTQNAGTIQFLGQSLIQAQDSGSWQPQADGTTGSAPANYGAQASAGFATAKAALRNIQLALTSPVINVNNGRFDSASLTFGFPTNATSALAYNVTGLVSESGAISLTGYATNRVTALATLSSSGGQQTLTIPVDATFVFTLVSANDTTIELKGQLVAVSAATPTLAIASVTVQTQAVTLRWQGTPGQGYQVHSSADLAVWQTNALNVTSTNASFTWSGPATGPRQFFRLGQ